MYGIRGGTYITGAADRKAFITAETKPVIAVSGRSNVGKSSFINALAGNNRLAKVSKEPGRTRLVNYFDFKDFILADLPGYGYAKVSKAEMARWGRLMDDFFSDPAYCTYVMALCDIRRDPTDDDMQMIDFMYRSGIPFTVTATKSDKVSRSQAGIRRMKIAACIGCGADDIICVSSETGAGMDRAAQKITDILSAHANSACDGKDTQ